VSDAQGGVLAPVAHAGGSCCGVSLRVPGARRQPVSSVPLSRRRSPGLRQGSDWVHEVKHDGYRLIAGKDAGRVTLWTRHGTDFTDRLPGIAKAVRSLPVDSALIDGEPPSKQTADLRSRPHRRGWPQSGAGTRFGRRHCDADARKRLRKEIGARVINARRVVMRVTSAVFRRGLPCLCR
jgi:hypothetical protein